MGDAPPPAVWLDIADSALTGFLRMLADIPEPDTVAASIAQGVLAPFGPAVTAIGFVDVDREVLVLAGVFGGHHEARASFAAVPLDADIPATLCYRTNAIVTAASQQMAQDFPLVAPYVNASGASAQGEAITFPLRQRGAVVAVLGLEFPRPVPQPWLLRAAVSSISGPLALWACLRMQLDEGPETYWSRRRQRPLAITERQAQVIALVRAGRTNAQIAEEIGFSVPTVKSELARLCALLGATDREDLVAKAGRAGY